jgi:hypothetical protein
MKQFIFFLFALLTFNALSLYAQTCQGNLLGNANFEAQGLNLWEGNSTYFLTNDAASGLQAAKVCGSGTIRQTKIAVAGKTYTLSLKGKVDVPGTPGFASVKFLTSSYQPLPQPLINLSFSTYTSVTGSFLAPAGTAFIEVSIFVSSGNNCVFADDFCLTDGSCNIAVTSTPAVCLNNGTPNNPADDQISFTFKPTNDPSGWVANLPQAVWTDPFTGVNNETKTITLPRSAVNSGAPNGTFVVTVLSNSVAGCSTTFSVTVPPACASTQAITLNCPTNKIYSDCFFPPVPGACNQCHPITLPTGTTTCPQGGLTFVLDQYTVLDGFLTINNPANGGNPAFGLSTSGYGRVEVVFKATDACGNTAFCVYQITVNQSIPDVTFTSCPTNIVVTAATGQTSAIVTYSTPTIACGTAATGPSTSANTTSGSSFPVGTTQVIWTASNNFQNTSCQFNVTVNPSASGGTCVGNLLQNSGFENNLTNWTGTGGTIVTDASAGTKALKVCGGGNSIKQSMTAVPGDEYTLKLKGKQDVPGNYAFFQFRFFNAANEYLSGAGDPLNFTTYTSVQRTAIAPFGTTRVDVEIVLNANATGCALVDEFCFTKITPPKPDLTATNLTGPTSGQQGAVLNNTLNYTLNNIGLGTPTTSFFADTYLSTDNVFSANDVLVDRVTLATVNTPVNGSMRVISTLTPGNYFLFVVIDPTNTIAEVNEQNNVSNAVPFQVTAGSLGGTCNGNLLGNPDFESGNTTWTFSTGAITSNSNFAQFCQTGQLLGSLAGPNFSIKQTVPAVAGKTYNLTCNAGIWTFSAQLSANIGMRFKNSAGTLLLTEQISNQSPSFFTNTTLQGCTYQMISLSKLAPVGTTSVEIFAETGTFSNATGAAALYVDNFCFIENISTGGSCSPDVTPPQITCPSTVTYSLVGNLTQATWANPVATDNCPTTPGITNENASQHSPGSYFPQGQTTVVYKATDGAGNTKTCSFIVSPPVSCMISNPGFEDGLSNWESGTGQVIATVASAGTKSMKLCQNSTIRQTLATTAGKTLTFVYKARTETGTGKVLSYIKYLSSSYQPLVTEFVDFSATTTYASGSVTKLSPANTAWVEVGFLKNDAGCVFVDELCLSEGGTSNPLPDLTLANINITNPTVANGSPFTFKYDIKNIGTASTTNTFITQLYFSTDNVLSANDLAVYTEPAFFLVAGQTNSQINSGFNVTGVPSGTYYLIMKADGNNQMTESDENNNVLASTTTFTVTGGGGTNCAISNIIGTTIPCNDNGTPNIATDDTYSFNMIISGTSGCGSGWTGGIAPFTTGTYGVGYGMGPYLISGGNTVLTIRDNVNPAVTTIVTVVPPPTCSANVSPKPDLELSLTATPQSPGQWKNTVLTLTLKNNGLIPATNVAVDFINQSNVQVSNMLAYISHVAPASTNFNSWTGFWNVGTVAAGQTLVLTYTGFTKLATQIPIFSQVKTENPTDADSSPGNNTTGNPTEDDEARVVINVNFLAAGERQLDDINQIDLEKMTDYTLFPNPAGESVSILLNEKAIQSQSITTPSIFTFFNQLGKPVYQKIIDADILENRVLQVDLNEFSNGLYLVKMETAGQRAVVKRLIVSRMY